MKKIHQSFAKALSIIEDADYLNNKEIEEIQNRIDKSDGLKHLNVVISSGGFESDKMICLVNDVHTPKSKYVTNWDVSSLYWQMIMPYNKISTSDYQNRVVATNKNINRFKNKEIPSNTKGYEGTPSWSLLKKFN